MAGVYYWANTNSGVLYRYQSESFTLELKLPNNWIDYKTISGGLESDGQIFIHFFLPTKDKDYPTNLPGYADIFGLEIYSKSEWENILLKCQPEQAIWCPKEGDQLIDNGQFYVLPFPSDGGIEPSDFLENKIQIDGEYLRKNLSFVE